MPRAPKMLRPALRTIITEIRIQIYRQTSSFVNYLTYLSTGSSLNLSYNSVICNKLCLITKSMYPPGYQMKQLGYRSEHFCSSPHQETFFLFVLWRLSTLYHCTINHALREHANTFVGEISLKPY